MRRLEGKVALVTGAAQGIGAACVRLFAQHGARVVINVRQRDERARALLSEVGVENALIAEADVADADSVQRMAEAALERFGRWIS